MTDKSSLPNDLVDVTGDNRSVPMDLNTMPEDSRVIDPAFTAKQVNVMNPVAYGAAAGLVAPPAIKEAVRRYNAPPPSMSGAPAAAPSAAVAPTGSSLIPDDAGHSRIIQGGTEDGVTGRARQTGYNARTAAQAAEQKLANQNIQKLIQQGVLTGENPLIRGTNISSATPSGIMVPPEANMPPKAAPVSKPQGIINKAKVQVPKVINALDVIPHGTSFAAQAFRGAGRTLAGAGAGFQGADAYNRFQAGDYPGAAISGIGAVGSAASLIPTPYTRVLGTGVGLGAEALNSYIDYLKKQASERGPVVQEEQPGVNNPMAQGGLVHLAKGGQPEFGEARAYEPSYSERIRDFAAQYMSPERADILFGGPRAQTIDKINPIGMALQTPGTIADAAKGFVERSKEGNYPAAMGNYAVGALNALPLVKPVGQVAKTAARELGPKAANMVEDYLGKIGGIQYAVPPKTQKFSEAIEPFIDTHSIHPTIVDKTKLDLAAKRMAGPEAPYLQEISQPHKESGWIFANDSMGAASKLYNMGKDGDTLITGLLGSPTQLKTNRSVFGELADEYFKAIKEGRMTPELQAKIEARLPTLTHGKEKTQTFPTKFDIRDREAFNEMAKGFHQRGHLADIMSGKGVSQGLPRGTGKIIPYDEILMRNTEQSLLEAPTHSIGSRLFTVGSKPPEYRPDLHNAFDYANFGDIKSGNFGFVPKEIAYPDEIARMKAKLAAKGIGREITAMDLMRNTIKQPITEKYWRNVQAAGFKKGGSV